MKDRKEETFSHPSYGLASMSRCQSSPKLFACPLTISQNTVRLTIYENVELIRGESGDRYLPHGKSAIEVEFSAAQFAEFVTTMNVGFGVPCTVRLFNGKIVENPPDLEPEAVKLRQNFGKRMDAASKSLEKHAKEMAEYLAKSNIPKKHWEPLLAPLKQMIQEVGCNSDFWLELFEEATEKVVTSAKAEVDAFVTSAIHRAGLEHIKGLAAPQKPELVALEPPKKKSTVTKAYRLMEAQNYLMKTHGLDTDDARHALINLEVPVDTGDPDITEISLEAWLLMNLEATEHDWKMTIDMALLAQNG